MILRRTANAGVLLTLDGVTVLLDGVCPELPPYLGTPETLRSELMDCPPDILAFTHGHKDHFDRDFARSLYEKTLRPILGPESLLRQGMQEQPVRVGEVTVTPLKSRHIGKAGQDTVHVSFLICGSKTVLFTGDAAPSCFREHPKADVLIAPYAYAITPAGWKAAQALADTVVIVHMPPKEQDSQGLWQALEQTTQLKYATTLLIPHIDEEIKV